MVEEKSNDVGVIVGRFQISKLHSQHQELINFVLNKHTTVVIFLGISDAIGTRKNPLDFITRKLMIEREFPSEKLIILPLKDCSEDKVWSQNLDNKISEIISVNRSFTLYGSKDSFIPYYTGKYPRKELESDSFISATDVRRDLSKSTLACEAFRAGIIYSVYNSYPTVYSTIDAAIIDPGRNRILLGRKHGETKWRLIGGFVDVKDNSETETVQREVREETGLEISNIKFVISQKINDWRYKNMSDRSIMTHLYKCEYIYGMPVPNDDIEELKWFDIQNFDYNNVINIHCSLIKAVL